MSVYLDTSTKGDGKGVTTRRHWIWRLDIRVEGKRLRCRSKSYSHLKKIEQRLRDGTITRAQFEARSF